MADRGKMLLSLRDVTGRFGVILTFNEFVMLTLFYPMNMPCRQTPVEFRRKVGRSVLKSGETPYNIGGGFYPCFKNAIAFPTSSFMMSVSVLPGR